MKDRLIHFETTPDAPPVGDAGVVDPPAVVVDPPAAVTPPDWTGPSREEWERTQQSLGEALPFLSELQTLLADDPAPPVDANLDPQAYLDQRMEQLFNERFGAFEPVLGQIAEREGEAAARSELDRIATEGGEFDRDLALIVAQQNVERMPPADALRAGAEYARQAAQRISNEAVEAYKQSLHAAATAPTDVSAPGAATTAPETATGRDRYEETLARFRSDMRPVNPTG